MKIAQKWGCGVLFLAMMHAGAALSQAAKPLLPIPSIVGATSASAPAAPPVVVPAATSQPIPLPDVAEQAEVAVAQLHRLENRNRVEDLLESAESELPLLTRDLSFRAREMQQLLTRNAPLETIRDFEQGWSNIGARAAAITRDLTRGGQLLDDNLKELEKLDSTWDATTKAATEAQAPQAVLDRAHEVGSEIASTKKKLLSDRAEVLGLQGKSADIGARAAASLQILSEAQQRAVTRLLYRESVPLWDIGFWSAWTGSFSKEAGQDLLNQALDIFEYVQSHGWRFALHALLFLMLVSVFFAVQSRIRALSENTDSLRRAGRVFDMPLVSALLITMLVSTWFYPRAPRSLWTIIGVLGTAPVLVFVRRMIDTSLYPVLYAVIGFYLSDRLRDIFSPLPGVSRLMLLVESLLAVLFYYWALRRSKLVSGVATSSQITVWRLIRISSAVLFFCFIIAVGANVGGFTRLSDLLVRTALGSAYAAVVLYALMRVGEGVVQGFMSVPPLSMLGMVQRHQPLLLARINRWLRWAAGLCWIGLTLQAPGMLQPLTATVYAAWNASFTIGTFSLSVESVFLFLFVLWAAYTLSRISRFVLEEEVFPKLRLERGLPYAITTMLHYILLLSGLILAVGAIGVDMTKFTILASAFSVGIGFGLQNIVNNFVSGLIVLFERPIKVGDVIQIDDVTGRVQRIGIRASVVRSTNGSDVIIPNAKLISDKVTNWTLSTQLRQIVIPIITKSDANPTEFKALLLQLARNNKWVVETPVPEALFIKRGLDTFEFELRVWTGELDAWFEVRSDLTTEIDAALHKNQISAEK